MLCETWTLPDLPPFETTETNDLCEHFVPILHPRDNKFFIVHVNKLEFCIVTQAHRFHQLLFEPVSLNRQTCSKGVLPSAYSSVRCNATSISRVILLTSGMRPRQSLHRVFRDVFHFCRSIRPLRNVDQNSVSHR